MKYTVTAKARRMDTIGTYYTLDFVVFIAKEGEPTRQEIITAWEVQWGALSDDGAYELHHIINWEKLD